MLTKLFWFLKARTRSYLRKKHTVFAILDTYKSPPNESTQITEIRKIVTYCRSSYNI